VTPEDFNVYVLSPGLVRMSRVYGIPATLEAAVLLMAIAGTESNWGDRLQIVSEGPPPARGFFMFEINGVHALLDHPVSKPLLLKLCAEMDIPAVAVLIHEAVAWNDPLAVGMARLLVRTLAPPLPALGDEQGAYDQYIEGWRPGAPDRDRWSARYATALGIVAPGHTLVA
jgi:hypothetical protein